MLAKSIDLRVNIEPFQLAMFSSNAPIDKQQMHANTLNEPLESRNEKAVNELTVLILQLELYREFEEMLHLS